MKKITQSLICLCFCNCLNAQFFPLQISPSFSSNLTFLEVLHSETNKNTAEVQQIIQDLNYSIDKALEHGEIRDSMFLVSNFIRLETCVKTEKEIQQVLSRNLVKKANAFSPGHHLDAVVRRMHFYEKHIKQ